MNQTLDDVAASFEAWRSKRRHCKERIPDELWQQVVKLIPDYPKHHIARRLGLSGSQLRHAQLRFGGDQAQREASARTMPAHDGGFAWAIPPAQKHAADQGRCYLSVKGKRRSIKLDLNVSGLQALFPMLMDLL